MKFSLDAVNLKSAMDRMLPLLKACDVTTIFPEYMHFIVNEAGAFLAGDSGFHALKIKLNANVCEYGEAYLHRSDIKRLSSISGMVTVSADKKHVCFQCAKKRVELINHNCDVPAGLYTSLKQDDRMFDIKAADLCAALAAVEAAADRDERCTRDLLKGYNINGRMAKIIACDGYRMHAYKFPTENESMKMLDLNRTMRGEAYTHLKAILKPCMDRMISVYDMEKFIKFAGEDFTYYIACIDGNYININNVIPARKDFDFEFKAGELAAIAKEYMMQCRGDGSMAMETCKDRLVAALCLDDYRTVDVVEEFDVQQLPSEEGYFSLFNPAYICDAMKAFDKNEIVTAYGEYAEKNGANVKPTMFVAGRLECLVLPVRINDRSVYKQLISSFKAA